MNKNCTATGNKILKFKSFQIQNLFVLKALKLNIDLTNLADSLFEFQQTSKILNLIIGNN